MGKKIIIPFNDWSKKRLALGVKTATSRNKKYGEPGDYFEVNLGDQGTVRYELVFVKKKRLVDIAKHNWKSEGCTDELEFIKVWCDIHPKKGFEPRQEVWYHSFIVKESKKNGRR